MTGSRVRYTVQLRGEFTLTAESQESTLKALQDIADAARLIPFFTGLKFAGATGEDVEVRHEIVSDESYVSLRFGDDEIEAGG